jgi:hypothetical protein
MLPILRDIVIQQGNTWSWTFTVYATDGAVANLVGASVLLQVRDGPDGALLAEATVALTDDAGGLVTATLADADTELMDWDVGAYDVRVVQGDGTTFTAYAGEAVFYRRVTRTS